MKPKVSLPHIRVSATCPYPEPDHSTPYLPSNFLNTYLNIVLPSTPESSKWFLSPQVSPPKCCMNLSSPPYMLHAPPFSFFIWSPEQYWICNTDHYALPYLVFSTRLLPRPSWAQISLATPYSPTPCSPTPYSPTPYSPTPYSPTPSALVPPPNGATKVHTHAKQQEQLWFCIS